uniref:Uncharacterized protein n=1 Tax=Clastoptera arizonana TaxID=38151 RepID=A0A1B6DIV1_9HEMI
MVVRPKCCLTQDLTEDDCSSFRWLCSSVFQVIISETVYELCLTCLKMSSIPQGAFAANKVRQSMTKYRENNTGSYSKLNTDSDKNQFLVNKKLTECGPLKYNSKMMDSIWGQYNRYSVHNLKKNADAKQVLLWAEQQLANTTPPAFHIQGYTPKNIF